MSVKSKPHLSINVNWNDYNGMSQSRALSEVINKYWGEAVAQPIDAYNVSSDLRYGAPRNALLKHPQHPAVVRCRKVGNKWFIV